MKNLTVLLKEGRANKGLKIKDVVMATNIDQAIISKIEKGDRMPTEVQLKALVSLYQLDVKNTRTQWLAEKVAKIIRYEPTALEVLSVAESRVEYLRSKEVLVLPTVPPNLTDKLNRIDELKEKWLISKPLDATQLSKMREFFNIEYTYESNRIEGNTLTLQETQLVVNEGITISGKSMQEHLEAINHSEAVDFIIDLVIQKEDLTKRNLLQLHALILKSIDRKNAGQYRKVPVRISGSQHAPPQPFELAKLMEDYFYHYESQKGRLHPILLAAEMHERLCSIHPFIDGNGRTSRLVMNLILLRNGYTITYMKGDLTAKLAYYKALEKVQVDNEPLVFYNLVADAVEQSLLDHLELV